MAVLEGRRQELEKSDSEPEMRLKTAQSTNRSLTEQLESLTTERAKSKKGDAKEARLREQVKKLEEKMRLVDVLISKGNKEKNSSIKGIEFCEMIHLNTLKEKGIVIADEKSKPIKLREEFIKR
jgi:hypothetical protein